MPVRLKVTNPALQACYTLHQVNDSLSKCEEEVMNKLGLTPQQYAVLVAIRDIAGPVNQKDVADWLDRDPASITFMIDRMEKEGLVKRKRDLKDRRTLRLLITPKGKEMLQTAARPYLDLSEQMVSCLAPKELAVFNKLLEKVREKTFEQRKIAHKVTNADARSQEAETAGKAVPD